MPARNGHILAISSMVAHGHVGLSAIMPTLHLIGREVTGLPTIVLSNHPGFAQFSGRRVDVADLDAMLDALAANGWLGSFDTILTGYLPSAGHVAFACRAIERVRAAVPSCRIVCDPVLGDDPKGLYIEESAAIAVRDRLLPLADMALPNRFELAWLTGRDVASQDNAIEAARHLASPEVIAKSIPHGPDRITNVVITQSQNRVLSFPRLDDVPNGTGDVFSALIAAGWTMERASAALTKVINASREHAHLNIIGTTPDWRDIPAGLPGPGEAQGFVAGVDGCPGGWLVVTHPIGQPAEAAFTIVSSFTELIPPARDFAALAVDMPIGLPDRVGTGGRGPDRLARAVLGERQSSVFPMPARCAVMCEDYGEACRVALATSDPPRKISKQAFNLFPKIREIDRIITPELQQHIIECHPEVAFWAMNGRQPLSEPKKVKSRPYGPGLDLRRKLLVDQGFAPEFLTGAGLPKNATADDLLDACAACWTASRLAHGLVERFPTEPATDATGLRVEICY